MNLRQRYRKKTPIVAIKLDLDTKGLQYRKWGGLQRAKPGDWLVKNGVEVYSVDAKSFARTYKLKNKKQEGIYVKKRIVWAEVATAAGKVKTKEGFSAYRRGDYLVFNERGGRDGYCIGKRRFNVMYELV